MSVNALFALLNTHLLCDIKWLITGKYQIPWNIWTVAFFFFFEKRRLEVLLQSVTIAIYLSFDIYCVYFQVYLKNKANFEKTFQCRRQLNLAVRHSPRNFIQKLCRSSPTLSQFMRLVQVLFFIYSIVYLINYLVIFWRERRRYRSHYHLSGISKLFIVKNI